LGSGLQEQTKKMYKAVRDILKCPHFWEQRFPNYSWLSIT